jgi:hypothetical protein
MAPIVAKFAQDLLTTADAAEVLGLSGDMVRLLAGDGRLQMAAEIPSSVSSRPNKSVSYTRGARRPNATSMIATRKRASVASLSSSNVRTRSRAKLSCGSAEVNCHEVKTTLRVGGVDGPSPHAMGAVR